MRSVPGRAAWVASITALLVMTCAAAAQENTWPPALKGASPSGAVTLRSDLFLKVPEGVQKEAAKEGAAPFVVASVPPTVDLAYHAQLPSAAANATGWSAWGDIGIAADGKVYSGIGDHGDSAAGKSFAFIYEWDPVAKTLRQVVDVNAIVPRTAGEPTWCKVHAGIHQASDGWIYFSGTLSDGNKADDPKYKWSEKVPGGQLYRYHPQTGKSELVANLPAKRCTATTLLDVGRNRWWCGLETGPNAVFAFDLNSFKPLYQSPDGSLAIHRNLMLAADGTVYFTGADKALWKCDAAGGSITRTSSDFPGDAMLRSSTHESSQGLIYGTTYQGPPGQLFRYRPARDELTMLGPDFLTGGYTTVCVLSPDEKFVYYCPGAHGGAIHIGTPVIQYRIATGQRKVIAFLREAFETTCDYVPGGTYGVKLSADGSTLYINLNGHPGDPIRPKEMKPHGFGLMAFAAVHIPEEERR